MPILNTIKIDGQNITEHPPIFLIHGLFGNGSNLTMLGKALSEIAPVYLVDALNHGQSPQVPSMSYQLQAESLLATWDALGITTGCILGHSMGGKIAMATALTAPERVAKLIVADMSPVRYEPHHHRELQALNNLDLSAIKSRKEADAVLAQYLEVSEVRQFLLKSLKREGGHWQWQFALEQLTDHYNDMVDWPYEGNHFDRPTLFIKGQRSNYIQLDYQQAITQQFPHAELKIIADAGHWLHADKPRLFNQIVIKYFKQDN